MQLRAQEEEFRSALRTLLMQPLLAPTHPRFPAVRRQAGQLQDWFRRETGWMLSVDRGGARLYKRPADLADDTRGLPGYDRRRYVLLCLACAVLERADPQITLQVLGDRLMDLAGEPGLLSRGFTFTLTSATERRELVSVCRSLLGFGVLQRVAGDEEGFVLQPGSATIAPTAAARERSPDAHHDALYDVHRRALAGLLAAVRGPSTWPVDDAPIAFEARLRSLVTEPILDSDEGRRTAVRHALARRLLDDPVVYLDTLDEDARAYFTNQRGVLAARLAQASGLVPEQRAEGLALTDEDGQLSDVTMPAEGTEAHATLLVAEHLGSLARQAVAQGAALLLSEDAIAAFLREATERYGRYWRKSAREPGAERELARIAIERLRQLQLVTQEATGLRPRPALARFALGDVASADSTEGRERPMPSAAQASLLPAVPPPRSAPHRTPRARAARPATGPASDDLF